MADTPEATLDEGVETEEEITGPKGEALVKRWADELTRAEKRFEKWVKRGEKVVKRYRDERSDEMHGKRFNLLWSNVETLKPALYSRQPQPDIRRRFADKAPVARVASEIIERCVTVDMEMTDFNSAIEGARDDRLLPGRGVVWARYEPTFVTEQGEEGPYERVETESQPIDYVYWQDFLHGHAKTWARVPWVARRLKMSRKQLKKRFKAGDKVELHDDKENSTEEEKETFGRGEVWEIWDKDTGNVLWICKTYKEGPLDMKPAHLKLREFFPCPRPLYATKTTDSLIPVPDFAQYQDQADEIDAISTRISNIVAVIRAAGVFDGKNEALGRLLDDTTDNLFIPHPNLAELLKNGGMLAAMQFLPVKEFAETLIRLYEARDALKEQVYEVTGIADIIRGASKASETATAQRIKGNFATLRLDEHQRETARFARDCIRLKAEIIAEHFSDETLVAMSGAMEIPEVRKDFERYEREKAEYEQAMQAYQQQMQPQAQGPMMGAQPQMGMQSGMMQQ